MEGNSFSDPHSVWEAEKMLRKERLVINKSRKKFKRIQRILKVREEKVASHPVFGN